VKIFKRKMILETYVSQPHSIMSGTNSRPTSSRPLSARPLSTSKNSRNVSAKISQQLLTPREAAKVFIDYVCEFWQERYLQSSEPNPNFVRPVWVYSLQQSGGSEEEPEYTSVWETPCNSRPISLASANVYWKYTV
jgi:hypothetical protein